MDISNLKKRVEMILKEFPETRENDIKLTIKIWRTFYSRLIVNDTIRLDDMHLLPREDNIKRIRAKFNEEGKYLPKDPMVLKKRGLLEKEWKQEMSTKNKDWDNIFRKVGL